MQRAADAAPGPLSALAAAIATFATRALRNRRLAWAVIAEPVDADTDAVRQGYRMALAGRDREPHPSRDRWRPSAGAGRGAAAPALLGAMLEGLIGPLAPRRCDDPARAREAVQTLMLFALRGLGVVDAHARGLVVQTALPDWSP